MVAGVEAGGNLAAVAAMMARDRGGPALAAQILVAPMLDPTLTSHSMQYEYVTANAPRSQGACNACYRAYLPNAADRLHPYAAPSSCPRVAGLAPALILTAEDDPLRDEAEAYGGSSSPPAWQQRSCACRASKPLRTHGRTKPGRSSRHFSDPGSPSHDLPLTTPTERSNTMSKQHLAVLPMALALAALAELSACSKPEAQGGPPPGPPPVSVAAAVEREVIDTDEFPGRIEAVATVEVRARINGYIQSVNFKPGAEVRKGDLLFVIDPRPLEAELSRAEATLANTRAQLDLSRTELTRFEQLLAEQATSKREYDDAAAKVRQFDAQIRANQASVDTARLNLAYTRVTAPIAGRVGKDEITVGNLVQGEASSSPLLTTVVSSNPIYASFQADEGAYLKYIGKARDGALTVAVGLADEQAFPHAGRLEFVDNRVDPQSGTVRMRAILDNKDGRFTPGLFARVKLGDGGTPRKAVLVADRAIGTDQSKRFVLVVNGDNKAQYREVRIGRLAEGLRVVESGLKPGEVIVVNGLQRVRPGAPVTPQTVPMEARATGQAERVAAKE